MVEEEMGAGSGGRGGRYERRALAGASGRHRTQKQESGRSQRVNATVSEVKGFSEVT